MKKIALALALATAFSVPTLADDIRCGLDHMDTGCTVSLWNQVSLGHFRVNNQATGAVALAPDRPGTGGGSLWLRETPKEIGFVIHKDVASAVTAMVHCTIYSQTEQPIQSEHRNFDLTETDTTAAITFTVLPIHTIGFFCSTERLTFH